jgi:hypothetical protein
MNPNAPAVARVGLTEWKWFTESSRSGTVVLGNHPYGVRWISRKLEMVNYQKGSNMGWTLVI